ncbi:hypothetical protein [Kitasatospora setae]|uniref:Acetyltransferase n=1 Tax=Kitasatospora setae (strain ATCC 33774 / DSM 43861 / JCM 3304 / KCC A-0304 / NBRC 14216 / KM-6054) TaxID=452652 RepID=E4N5J3_KITSK|nr:hypothetical protein KSE_06330 [Kitasatospora setae KM-6054]
MELSRYGTLTGGARRELLAVYADVRAPLLHLPNYRVAAFAERLDGYAAGPGFGLVLGRAEGSGVVGYAYGTTVAAGDRYWARMAEPLPAGFTDAPVLALREIGVRAAWRGSGTARRIHDALVAGRAEGRAVLMVNPLAGEGKVLRVYESWGYEAFNSQAATADSPRLLVMVRPAR